jgi:hypothetical protein
MTIEDIGCGLNTILHDLAVMAFSFDIPHP